MRDLPVSIPAPQRVQLDDPAAQRAQDLTLSTIKALATCALFRVATGIKTTGAAQRVNAGAIIGTWWPANMSAPTTIAGTFDGMTLTFTAGTAGVTLDIVFLT